MSDGVLKHEAFRFMLWSVGAYAEKHKDEYTITDPKYSALFAQICLGIEDDDYIGAEPKARIKAVLLLVFHKLSHDEAYVKPVENVTRRVDKSGVLKRFYEKP